MPSRTATLAFLATCFASGWASAEPRLALGATRFAAPVDAPVDDDTVTSAPVEKVPASDLRVDGHAGVTGGKGSGLVAGATGLARFGFFQIGGLVEGGGALFDYDYVAVAAASGVALRTPSGLRLDLLGVAGDHHYTGVGGGFLTHDPGATGDLLFVGARVGASYAFGGGPARFELGVWGFAEDDLGRKTQRYTYGETGLLGASPVSTTVTHDIGAQRFGAALRLGVTFDR